MIPSQQQQIEAIQEAESADAPSAFSVPQEEIDRALRGYGGKMRIYALYQQNLSQKDITAAIRKEYGLSGHSITFQDGTDAFLEYRPNSGMEFWRTSADKKFVVKWTAVEKRIRQLIADGRYLSRSELEKYQSDHLEQPAPAAEEAAPLEEAPPTPVTREITQADIDAALQEWNGDIASKRRVQQYMESHAREKGTAAWLKNEYGDNFPAYPVHGTEGGGTDLPWSKVQRHLARLVKEDRFFTEEELDNFADIDTAAVREQLEQAENRPSPFVEQVIADVEQTDDNQNIPVPEQNPAPSPTVREIYEQYKPVIKGFVLSDGPYQNACKNSDWDTAVMEGHEAVTRAALTIQDTNFMRLYFDMPAFHNRLHREIIDETYPTLSQPQQEQGAVPDLSGQPVPVWAIPSPSAAVMPPTRLTSPSQMMNGRPSRRSSARRTCRPMTP